MLLTLGDSYLSADYERSIFNVSACVWNEGAEQNIVTVASADGSTGQDTSGSASSAHLSSGAIAGIVVGCALGAALIVAILFLIIRRRNLVITYAAHEPEPDEAVMSGPIFEFQFQELRVQCADGVFPGSYA